MNWSNVEWINLPRVLTQQHRIWTRVLLVESPKLYPWAIALYYHQPWYTCETDQWWHTSYHCEYRLVASEGTGPSWRPCLWGWWWVLPSSGLIPSRLPSAPASTSCWWLSTTPIGTLHCDNMCYYLYSSSSPIPPPPTQAIALFTVVCGIEFKLVLLHNVLCLLNNLASLLHFFDIPRIQTDCFEKQLFL